MLVRGREYEPLLRSDLLSGPDRRRGGEVPGAAGVRRVSWRDVDPFVVGALVRMARLAGAVGDALRDCPDPAVRRSAAILAARAYPLRAAFDE